MLRSLDAILRMLGGEGGLLKCSKKAKVGLHLFLEDETLRSKKVRRESSPTLSEKVK